MKESKGKNFCFPLSERTYIMGILNVTEDSFSDTGKYSDAVSAVAHAIEMQENGADIIDVGVHSTAPGSAYVSEDEETERLKAVLPAIREKITVPISVDTYYPKTAEYALENGADIINDVSGVFNPQMARVIKTHGAGWILTHGISADIQSSSENAEIVSEISSFFNAFTASAKGFSIDKSQLCLDVGIGFGKSREGDLTVLREMKRLVSTECAMLVGASRKRFIGYASGEEIPENRLKKSAVFVGTYERV